MKLAFSTNAYTRFPLTDALRGIRAAGFEGVEILADVPHAYPGTADAALIRRELERLGFTVSNVNANCAFGYWRHAPPEPYFEPSIISPDPKLREDRIELIFQTLQFAHDIGAGNISITSGRMLGGMPPDKAAKQFGASIARVLKRAEELGVNVGIECEPGLFLEYVSELREWIDLLKHPRVGANLDIGHSQVIGEPIDRAVKLLGDRIWNMHVEDIPGRKHYHMIPGEGTLDWPKLRDALRDIHYDRFLTVELYTHTAEPQAAAERSFEFLSKLLDEMPEPSVHLVVMTKLPVAGRVKTRLTPELSPQQAAAVHEIFLRHTAARLQRLGDLVICYDPPGADAAIRQLIPDAVRYLPQSDGDLGTRLARALQILGPEPVLFFGTDSPDMPDKLIRDALQLLAANDLVVGPCDDGGYWCLGATGNVDAISLLSGIEWSTGRELAQTLARARTLGYRVGLTQPWSDVDRPDDLRRLVARLRTSDNAEDMKLLDQLSSRLELPLSAAPPDGVI